MVLYLTCELFADRKFKMAVMRKLSLTLDPMGISYFHLIFRNQYWTTIMLKNKQTIIKQCVKSLFKLTLFGNSKPGERLQAPGSLWFQIGIALSNTIRYCGKWLKCFSTLKIYPS